jgi:hypothetical protein
LILGLLSSSFAEFPGLQAADAPKPGGGKRPAVAKCVSAKASMLRREPGAKDWHVVAANEPLRIEDLLLGLPGAQLDSAKGGVRLTFQSDLDGLSPYAIVESAVVLHNNPNVDLEFVLDRGRVDLVNRKKEGAARVGVWVRDAQWELTLAEPGTRIALELYGRWPRGTPFIKEPGPKDAPTADLIFLVVSGEVSLKHGSREHLLTAPPGLAMIEWDSVTGQDEAPQRLEKLPPWATAVDKDSPTAKAKREVLERLRQRLMAKPIGEVLDELLNSDQEAERRLAVNAMGALDDLERLGKALREAKHPDVWQNGVLAFRHWIGRGPGQDQLLYKTLVEVRHYSPVHAETVLQLLHSFSDADLARPETYQTLIDYLDHDQLGIRGLAYWHLVRLVPAGKELGYDPLGPKDAREAAIQKWRKLVPPGKVPSRPANDKKK